MLTVKMMGLLVVSLNDGLSGNLIPNAAQNRSARVVKKRVVGKMGRAKITLEIGVK